MRMGEFSRRTGVSQRLLRYYEEQGLLAPSRLPSGYREYSEADVATVRGIRMLLAAGLGTATIAELLPCMTEDGNSLAPACSGMLPDLNRERERLDAAVADLLAARDALDDIIAATEPTGIADPEACAAIGAAKQPADIGAAERSSRSARGSGFSASARF
ncbi:DNA-binding transcriptional regulator, MerR family [Saccharopolyspora antimicrobica]|uniref:DNA-binding transcriptional MerR regulator n=1 Tax=Saccharopolyspora antimicrobica TaxID=455193 RepID=A0A1I5D6I3_9PSEU|nr:DNA-binding transcriptional MerR regulator [Saccharopolyspora antimicrobica]SFN94803.1 DNA-binding transcriptional regulator, MerR family [Saccharopolyspora antimicrobica]